MAIEEKVIQPDSVTPAEQPVAETASQPTQTITPKYLGKDRDGVDTYWYEGNNALPLADGRCCDTCNGIVIADRITNIRMKGV